MKILQVESRDYAFYRKAKYLASFSSYRVRVGAFAAHNGKALAGAFNTIRNPTKNAELGGRSFHAEFNCLRMVPDRLLTRITLYVARIDYDGLIVPSKPCHRCMGELAQKGVKEVVYLDSDLRVVKRKLQ